MINIIISLLLFVLVIGGLGLPLTGFLRLEPDERLCIGAALGCILVYLAAGIVYVCVLPHIVFWLLPLVALGAALFRRRALAELFANGGVRRLAGLWLLVAAWCLGLQTLVFSYSGGWWVGDWFEHYQRTQFFLQHPPLDTVFLQKYALPARPPLANLTVGAFMALTQAGFASFQIFTTLLASLAFIPAALLARHFRKSTGGDPAPALVLLLMLSPFFVENATLPWTKLPTVFFTLTGLFLFLKSGPVTDRQRALLMSLCLGAALLTHYSSAPYVLILAVVWCWRRRADWLHAAFWRESLRPLAAAIILLSTWFVWSAWHYGAATFLSNSTVTGNTDLSLAQQLAQKGGNLFVTLVPHPLRPDLIADIPQASALSYWRDYFFNIYQTTLPLACGSGGLIALCALIWRRRWRFSFFWAGFITAAVVLNTLVTPGPDLWGTVHICLQPVVLLALAWLAAEIPSLGRGLKAVLVAGLAMDFALGIALHFWVQHLAFPSDLLSQNFDRELQYLHGYAMWNNLITKHLFNLKFIGDAAPPAVLLCGLLACLLALAVSAALGRKSGATQNLP